MADQSPRVRERSPPSGWVERFIGSVRPGGHVLDVACGSGRHLRLCLDRGLRVTGIDRDVASAAAALGAQPGLELIARDLEDGRPFPFASGAFDGLVVTNYLFRPILPAIVESIGPAGVLIYETFRIGNARFGKPSNPAFLLQPGELLRAVEGRLHVVAFQETRLREPERVVQRICAVGQQHPWHDEPPQICI